MPERPRFRRFDAAGDCPGVQGSGKTAAHVRAALGRPQALRANRPSAGRAYAKPHYRSRPTRMHEDPASHDIQALNAATRLATAHGAGPLGLDGYEQVVELCGRVAQGWLFRYRVVCRLNIASEDQELFAGAVGCVVTDEGQVTDVPGPAFMPMLLASA